MKLRKILQTIPLLISVIANANIGVAKADDEIDADISQPKLDHVHLPSDIGGKMFYHSAGDPQGQRVIFIHGTPGSKGAWKDYLAEVPSGFEYISVDRPGFGDSSPQRAVPIMRQVEIMEQFLTESSTGEKPIIVGHSYGGTMVAIMAALYQDKLGGAVILAGSVSPELDNPRSIQKVGQYPPFKYLLPRNLRNANDEVIALEQEAKQFPAMWPDIKMPVVVLQGEKDPLVSVKNVDFMKEKMINAKLDLKVLPGINHFLPWNSKDHVDERIRTAVEYSRKGAK